MKKKILLVDDEQFIVEVVSIALGGNARYELLVADDGARAVEAAHRDQPDLILMDIDMPVMDGLEACRSIKGDPSTNAIPVVMLTAMAQSRDTQAAFDAGADEYITKPFSPSGLMKKIEEMLSTVYSVGEEVRLKDGRVGTIKRRIKMEKSHDQTYGYHVAVETGTTSTVSADEIESLNRAA